MRETYTVMAGDYGLKVRADCHEQNIWNETTLIGVSRYAAPKLTSFIAAAKEKGERVTVNAGPYSPRLRGFKVQS